MLRRRILPTLAALALAVAACDGGAPSGLAPDARRSLSQGRSDARAWIAAGRADSVDTQTAVALGYLERLRLGFGSPFRLADQALHDPRLAPDSLGVRVAWAVLARLIDGAAYEVEPAALDRAGLGRFDHWGGAGRQHLRLIGGTIAESRDPRAGEMAVRLAYGLAAAEGNLPARAPHLAARAAALLRDREIAMDDARRLLRAAAADSADPMALLVRWRSERRFQVESPASLPIPADAELESIRIGLRLTEALRELAAVAAESRPARPSPADLRPGLLGPAAADALAHAAESLDAPPQTPVALAGRNYRKEMLDPKLVPADELARRERLVQEGISEERFVAAYGRLQRTPENATAPSLAVLWAAVSLRTYAQEPVWFPGLPAPSARELEERYGLAVRFGDDVPAAWRPFYRRVLDQSLSDLRLVLPSLDLKGLRVVIDPDAPRQEGTLAMHDPKGRRLLMPPITSLGTVAHELAHDLDWQVALRRYRVRGDYATDRATRTHDTRFAMRVHDLAAGASLEETSDRLATHARRPAEIFARSLDWFVAVSLASRGRVNGYLSSVQDDMLTGYGTVRPPDVTGTAGKALVEILDEVAPVYPGTREWFLRSYGPARAITAYDLMRRVLEQPIEEELVIDAADPTSEVAAAPPTFSQVVSARDAALGEIDAWICRAPGAAYDRNLELARRTLVVEAAAARARGLARDHARSVAGPRAERWLSRHLFGAPLSAPAADSLMVDLLRPIAESVRALSTTDPVPQQSSFVLSAPPSWCGAPLLVP